MESEPIMLLKDGVELYFLVDSASAPATLSNVQVAVVQMCTWTLPQLHSYEVRILNRSDCEPISYDKLVRLQEERIEKGENRIRGFSALQSLVRKKYGAESTEESEDSEVEAERLKEAVKAALLETFLKAKQRTLEKTGKDIEIGKARKSFEGASCSLSSKVH